MRIVILIEDTCGHPECSYEHGLSVYVETQKHKILVDTGATDAFIQNAVKLGVDLKRVDTVIVSHGHYDHAGGLLAFCRINPDAQIYMQRAAAGDYYHGERYIGIDKEIQNLSQIHFLQGDYEIDEELSLFTHITGRRFYPQSNLLLSERVNGSNVQDAFLHEQCLVIRTQEGAALLSGCAHNGILNILDRYQELYHGVPDLAVSGFHMMKKTDYTPEEAETIRETARELKKLKTVFYTGHCTGKKAFDLMKPIMGEQLKEIHSGSELADCRILVVMPVEDGHKELLKSSAENAEFTFVSAKEATREQVHGADIIIGNVEPELLRGTSKLKWLQLNSAGTDGYTAEGVLPKETLLTNATGAYGLAISEHMIGALLCIIKKLHLYAEDQKKHIWSDHGMVTSIYGAKTLVVGLGDIGSEFAVRMHTLGSQVTGIRRNRTEKPDYLEALYQMDAFYECLKTADIVASCLPGTKETCHIFDKKAFGQMKEGACFLNVGRGNAVDSYALADALNSGHLAGAAVDVTEPEPLPSDHPLWDAKNLLITPHISGNYHLKETHERIIRIATDNLGRFMRGEKLRNAVDFATGYRKL